MRELQWAKKYNRNMWEAYLVSNNSFVYCRSPLSHVVEVVVSFHSFQKWEENQWRKLTNTSIPALCAHLNHAQLLTAYDTSSRFLNGIYNNHHGNPLALFLAMVLFHSIISQILIFISHFQLYFCYKHCTYEN